MVAITLPDGSARQFDQAVSGAELAADIGPGLAKAALAVRVDGELRDLSLSIEKDAEVAIITSKSEEALELLRHDAAHVSIAMRRLSARNGVVIKRFNISKILVRFIKPKLSRTCQPMR